QLACDGIVVDNENARTFIASLGRAFALAEHAFHLVEGRVADDDVAECYFANGTHAALLRRALQIERRRVARQFFLKVGTAHQHFVEWNASAIARLPAFLAADRATRLAHAECTLQTHGACNALLGLLD